MERGEPVRDAGRTRVALPIGISGNEIGKRGGPGALQLGADGLALLGECKPVPGHQRSGQGTGSGVFFLTEEIEGAAEARHPHEKIGKGGRNLMRQCQVVRVFEFQQMTQSGSRFAEHGIRGIERSEMSIFSSSRHIGMAPGRLAMETFLQRLRVQPRAARLLKDGKMIGHKLVESAPG